MLPVVEKIDTTIRSRYRREGYIVLRNFFAHEQLQVLRNAFDALDGPDGKRPHNFADRLLVTRNLWTSAPEMKSLVWAAAPVAARLLGSNAVRLIDDVALVKPARKFGGYPTNWHQDAPNFPFDRRGFLTIWIALEDISPDQGALKFVPKSHRIGLLGAIDGSGEDVPVEDMLSADDREFVDTPVTTSLNAGDASVHDGAMLHGAGANTTDRPRRAWGLRFVPPDTLYTGGAHRSFDGLGLKPFQPLDHPDFPLIVNLGG